ncbi:hypothetical protein KCU95_g3351, partial [Aureobasidium melanogenum]
MSTKGSFKRTFRGRSLQGCLTCKDRHIKCDEGKPICQDCIKVNRECVQRDGSWALPPSTSSDAAAVDTSNTTLTKSLAIGTTVDNLGVGKEDGNTSETEQATNTISDTKSEPLSKYKEIKIGSTDHHHDINSLAQNINKLTYPQTIIMDKKTPPKVNPAASVPNSDKNAPKSITSSTSSSPKMNGTKRPSSPAPDPKFITPLPLASTTKNRPPSATFTPLKPIHHWVPPRPTIIARTDLPAAEIAELRAEEAARKAEKETDKKKREREIINNMDPPWPTAAAPPIPPAPPCTQEQLDRVRAELAPRFRILRDLLDEQVAGKKERALFICVALFAVKTKLLEDAEKCKDRENC